MKCVVTNNNENCIRSNMDYDLKTLSGRIRYVRKEIAQMGQVEFAKSLGLRQQTISRWESGETNDPRHINKIIPKYKISLQWLLDGKGEAFKQDNTPEWSQKVNEHLAILKESDPQIFESFTKKLESMAEQQKKLLQQKKQLQDFLKSADDD